MKTNSLSSSRYAATLMLALLSGASFVACGPTARIDNKGDTGGTGGSSGAGVGGAGGTGGVGGGTTMPAANTLMEIDLGPKKLNVLLGFEVPEHALGVTAIVEAPALSDIIGISRLRNPAGEYVAYDYSVMGKANFAFVKQGWVGAATVQSDLPQAWPVQSGLWRILLGSDGPLDSANVSIWVRHTVDGAFHGGVIDVNVFVVPNGAPQSYLDVVVGDLFKDYAGLTLGNVNYLPLDGAFSIIDTYEQYRGLLASSASVKGTPALNMFVISKFGSEFGQAIGVAGGIPGSATLHGTTMSGVAYLPSGDPKYDVTVLRHEIGHLAGLFHTTELATEDTDPISDTVECDVATIQSKPDQCPDVSNTMFPIAFGNTDLTLAQERVIQGSALYRGVWASGDAPDPPSNAIAPKANYKPDGGSFVADFSDKPMSVPVGGLERVLGGVWCANGGGDYEALAIRVAGALAAESLRAIVVDERRADVLRARALGAYVRVATGGERTRALELAEGLAHDAHNAGVLRVGALDTLTRFDVPRARAVSAALSSTSSPALREVSKRLRLP